MTVLSNPIVNITKAPASGIVSNFPQRVLMVGQQTGSVYTTGTLIENVSSLGGTEVANLGKDSQLAQMVREFRNINQETQLDFIPLDDNGGGVAASGNVTVTGTSTETGTFTVYVGSKKNNAYEIAVASGDTATAIGDLIEAAIDADVNAPFNSTNTGGSVSIDALNAGTLANDYGIEVIIDNDAIAGLTFATTGFASGATDPSLTNVFDVVGDKRYQTVVWPYSGDLTELTDFLDPRFNADNKIIDGIGVISLTDTFSNIETVADAENSQSLAIHGNKVVDETLYKGSAVFEIDFVIAAEFGALRSFRLTDDTNLSRLTITPNGARDGRGGTHIASFPYFNTPFFNLEIIETGKGFLDTEVDDLLDAGVFVIGNNTARNTVILGQVKTTYKTDVAGNPDPSFGFMNAVDTISNIAEFFFNNFKKDFAQYRLTVGDLVAGYNMANEDLIRATSVKYYTILSGQDFVLTRAGDDNVRFFRDNLVVTLDLVAGLVTIEAQVPIVVQLRQINATLKIVFDTTTA